MKYAPIIIPTLNRYQHLKNCVESLARNKYAQYSDLYISVDYPPNEKYYEGYNQIKNYIENGIMGFKNVYYTFQKENLGPFDNERYLRDWVFETNDRFIFSEDDNYFSPNFLEYINKNLDYFENDKRIFAISGYSKPIEWGEKKYSIIQNIHFGPYGYGTWKDRNDRFETLKYTDIRKYLFNYHNALNLYKTNEHYFVDAVEIAIGKHYLALNKEKKIRAMDITKTLYAIIYKMYFICPLLSRSRNMGYDGSGINCKVAQKGNNDYYDEQEIDEESSYNFSKPIEIDRNYIIKFNSFYKIKRNTVIKAWIKWLALIKIKGFTERN